MDYLHFPWPHPNALAWKSIEHNAEQRSIVLQRLCCNNTDAIIALYQITGLHDTTSKSAALCQSAHPSTLNHALWPEGFLRMRHSVTRKTLLTAGLFSFTKSPAFIYHIQSTIIKKMLASADKHANVWILSGFICALTANHDAGLVPETAGITLFIYLHQITDLH